MRRAAVIGVDGLVGSSLWHGLSGEGIEPLVTCFGATVPGVRALDIRSAAAVDQFFHDSLVTEVYLAAGLTNVDYCELHPAESYLTNVVGVGNVVRAAQRVGATVVFFSSDYVFDGRAGPYDERAIPNPLSVYGSHKTLAELYVSQLAQRWLIIRTTGVYGWEQQGKNFIYRLCRTLQRREIFKAPHDQMGSPTFAPALAATVVQLARQGATGVFNVAGSQLISRYEFARAAAAIFGFDLDLIQPVDTVALDQPARRPLKAGLQIDKVTTALGVSLPDCQSGLHAMVQDKVWTEQA